MNCPACKEAMIVLEHDRVEIDHCPSCQGNWLDQGELELLLGSSQERNHLLSSFEVNQNSQEKKRKCPICLKKMEKVLCKLAHDITIDRCQKKDGLWFDLGELDAFIKIGSFGKNAKVLDWLKNTFGKTKGVEPGGVR